MEECLSGENNITEAMETLGREVCSREDRGPEYDWSLKREILAPKYEDAVRVQVNA